MLRINFVNQVDDRDADYLPTMSSALKQAYRTLGLRGPKEIAVILVGEDEIRRINREYRDVDRVTDVISFPDDDGGRELGDVFICVPRAVEQAEAYGHPFARELGFLAVHGFLHCVGYDHATPEEEQRMFALQEEILLACGLRRS
jgi:probable rRNA maturation factor